MYKAVGLYVVCLSACISQVKLSLPDTFDLVQLKSWTRHMYSVCECLPVCLSGYGDYIGREYIGGDNRGRGLRRHRLSRQ